MPRCVHRLRGPLYVGLSSMSLLVLSACASPGGVTSSTGANQVPFTCCVSGDIRPIRHPGEAVKLHWINSSSDPASTGGVATVRLEAGLSGPFDSVDELKAAEGGTATITAPVVLATTEPGSAPVSTLRIPKDASAGFYDLTTTISQGGGVTYSSGSVIRVEPN